MGKSRLEQCQSTKELKYETILRPLCGNSSELLLFEFTGFLGHVLIFKRLRATAGQGPNYVGPLCGYVGVCWPILRAMWAHLVAMLAYVGLMLIHVEPKDPKNGNSKKNTVKRMIF